MATYSVGVVAAMNTAQIQGRERDVEQRVLIVAFQFFPITYQISNHGMHGFHGIDSKIWI